MASRFGFSQAWKSSPRGWADFRFSRFLIFFIFGISARHLRRLFREEIGQTPKQVSDSQRLDFARKLTVETDLPFTEICFSSGFSSLRRFNDAFKKRFSSAPSVMRRRRKSFNQRDGSVCLFLSYRPPYHWNAIYDFLKSHAVYGCERFEDNTYMRYFLDEQTKKLAFVTIRNVPEKHSLEVVVTGAPTKSLFAICQRVRKMFDLNSDPLFVAKQFARSKFLDRIYKKNPGLRLPRAWDGFEVTINTILGQFVSIAHAQGLVKQLVLAHGTHYIGEDVWLFPEVDVLAASDFLQVKTTQRRRETLRDLCQSVLDQRISFDDNQDFSAFREAISNIRGIGDWTTEYVALRALGDTDAFPARDLVIGRTLDRHPEIEADKIAPWRAYLTIYLWKEFASLYTKGGKKNALRNND